MESLFEVEGAGESVGARAPGETNSPVPRSQQPLPVRMRPHSLAEFAGQEHLLAEGSALRTAIEEGRPHSMILYGPPGSGKTTLARIIASSAQAAFEEYSAVAAGRAEVREVLARAAHRRATTGEATIFFLDEIHRFNKAQQDALLPAVEEGLVTLIGATTENPYFEVNSALLSRARIYELHPLGPDDIQALLRRALERGECGDGVDVPADVLEFLAQRSAGDARTALSALELACATATASAAAANGASPARASGGPDARPALTIELAQDALQRRAVRYDKDGDQHYDYISAWIKSTRGSDPDASLYYLSVMLESGEDPRFIARRMVVLASEDIGNADPHALPLAVAAAHAVEHVGMPECRYALAQAAIYLSLAPKSNAALRGLSAATAHIREHGAAAPPPQLRSAAYPGAAALGRGLGYDYPHNRPGHFSAQELLPDQVAGARFFDPDEAEPESRGRLDQIHRGRERAGGADRADGAPNGATDADGAPDRAADGAPDRAAE